MDFLLVDSGFVRKSEKSSSLGFHMDDLPVYQDVSGLSGFLFHGSPLDNQ